MTGEMGSGAGNGASPGRAASEVAPPGPDRPEEATAAWDGLMPDGSTSEADAAPGSPDGAEADPTADGASEAEADLDVAAEEAGESEDGEDQPKRGRRGVAKLIKERDDYLDQLRRSRADFENYRKRVQRQQSELEQRAAEDLVDKLLVVLDNFDSASVHGEGYEQAHASLVAALEREGLTKICPEGQPFDPNEAEAVAHEDGDDGPVVAEVLRSGYRWKGRVLRPAMVRVRG